MVLGIVSFFCFGFITGPLAVVLGVVALGDVKKGASGRGQAVAGIVCGSIAFAIFIVAFVVAQAHGEFFL